MSKTLLLLVILLTGWTICAGQDQNSTFLNQIQKSIEEKFPNWRLVKSRIPKRGDVSYFEWQSGQSEVAVLIFARRTREEAAAALSEFPNFLGLIKSQGSLAGLGDENFVWQRKYSKSGTGVDFRKGTVAVHVAANSLNDAELFARLIDSVLPAAEQTLGADSP
jgi:hypothetical protein